MSHPNIATLAALPPRRATPISDPARTGRAPESASTFALALRSLYDEHRRIRLRFASRLGLTPTEFSALLTLAERGDLPSKQLASELDITPSAVTAMVGHLEEAGYVARVMHPSDRRSVIVGLVAPDGKSKTWVSDEYVAAVEGAVSEFAPLWTPEITGALEQTAIAMRSVAAEL
jgi:DNA-binding CsgD family transcriptional regulator